MSAENPFAALISDTSKQVVGETSIVQKRDISSVLEDIFAFSLKQDVAEKKGYVFLGEQHGLLDLEALQHVLFERLFACSKSNDLLASVKKNKSSPVHTSEDKVIVYLYTCYKLLNDSSLLNNDEKTSVKQLIIENAATGFKNPVIYFDQSLDDQLIELLLDEAAYSGDFFIEICSEIPAISQDENENGLKEVFTTIVNKLKALLIKTPLATFDYRIFNVLKLFLSNETMAEVFLDCNQPEKPQIGATYPNTLLGAVFNISILPKLPSANFEHFDDATSQVNIQSTESMLWTKINQTTEQLHLFIVNLLKCSPKVKEKVLLWCGNCLKSNSDKGKLWNAQAPIEMNPANFTSASDGFMLQFCNVMLRLAQPFCASFKDKKVLKVDPTYCALKNELGILKGVHLPDMSEETCLLPTIQTDDVHEERLTAEQYTFITECFFMSHRAMRLGFGVAVDKLVRMNHEIGRMERAYNEAMAQSAGTSDTVDLMRERMTLEMSKYLSYKAQLSEPVFLNLMFNFISSSSYWLCQVAMHNNINGQKTYAPLDELPIILPVSDRIPDTLKCIPEFIIENIVTHLVFLMRFNPNIFEEQGYEKLHPILDLILIFMGSSNLVKNPHLRAQLAEGLEALLPTHKEEQAVKSSLGGYQRAQLFNTHERKSFIVESLLEVFVGIEMTGQSVEFEQKFNYRRPMYAVMEYLWQKPEYIKSFRLLAERAEKNMDAVTPPLFLRFVNLLMNDAVFLLDESLTNMAKLREMQTARERGEWIALPQQERMQNIGYLRHIGMIARFDNILGKDTIRTLEKLTSQITIVFTHSTMVDRMAAMLNYFLLNLVGPNKKNFKVKDQKDYSFDPAGTVLEICKIYANLSQIDAFCLAVSQDGRSYTPQLFTQTREVLTRIAGGGALIDQIIELEDKVAVKAMEHRANEEAMAEAPEPYLDPIMSTLMSDPVLLPSSKQIVDRTTIARHLLSDQTDPFNRAPLSMDQVIPATELAQEIRDWIAERKKK